MYYIQEISLILPNAKDTIQAKIEIYFFSQKILINSNFASQIMPRKSGMESQERIPSAILESG